MKIDEIFLVDVKDGAVYVCALSVWCNFEQKKQKDFERNFFAYFLY